MDRLEQLNQWLTDELTLPAYEIAPASSDASFRRYFRLRPQAKASGLFAGYSSLIVMDAPPDKENTKPFIHIADLLGKIGLNVPRLLSVNAAQGFLLLSDLGNVQYLGVLNEVTVGHLYQDALSALLVLQRDAANEEGTVPPYDRALLLQEMGLFRDWYLKKHLNIDLPDEDRQCLEAGFLQFAESALEQPRVFVHRDYHSRNLMQTEKGNPGILDFQDAVLGPVTYDLVSLLRDCYVAWPRAQVEKWALAYRDQAQAQGIIKATDEQTWLRWFDWMGVQRHLKASGIFARLNHRDNKPGYLPDIPRTLGYVFEVASRYRELEDFYRLLQRLVPVHDQGVGA